MVESLGKCKVCGEEAATVYPLLPGQPAFCSMHHNPKDAGPFGCDFSGPDDFDIPDEEWHPAPKFTATRKTFVWTDINKNEHRLEDIDDNYLENIIGFLRRKLQYMDVIRATYWSEVIVFLTKEQRYREKHKLVVL